MSHQILPALTTRQRQILEPLLRGMGQKGVALLLDMSVNTVHHHVKNIYRAYGVGSLAELGARLADLGHWDGRLLKDMSNAACTPRAAQPHPKRVSRTSAAAWERPRMRVLF